MKLKSGRWTLEAEDDEPVKHWWLEETQDGHAMLKVGTDADLRAIRALCDRALRAKAKKKGGAR